MVLVTVMVTGSLSELQVRAADKPSRAKIKVTAGEDGASVLVTIKKTKNAQGYQIMMKDSKDETYKEVVMLEKSGKKKRKYTVENLSGDTYSFKVRGYAKDDENIIWGKCSKVKTITIKGNESEKFFDFSTLKPGSVVNFGKYEQDGNFDNGKEAIEWKIFSNDGNELFMISSLALDCRNIEVFNWSDYDDDEVYGCFWWTRTPNGYNEENYVVSHDGSLRCAASCYPEIYVGEDEMERIYPRCLRSSINL